MKKLITFILFAFCVFSNEILPAQKTKIDSLQVILNSNAPDTTKIFACQQLYSITDSLHYAEKGLSISEKINFKSGISLCLLQIGRWYYFHSKEDLALNNLIRAVNMAELSGDKKILISGYRYIGFIYRPHEPYKAKEYYEKSLKLSEETGDEMAASYAYSALGNIYEGIYGASGVDNAKALSYYEKSLAIREKKGSPSEIASSLNETSRMYDANGLHQKAIELRLRGLDIAEKNKDYENIVYISNLLGNDFTNRLHDYSSGLKYQLKAFEAGKNVKNNFELLHDVSKSVALNYMYLGDEKNSNIYFLKSAMFSDSMRINGRKYDYNISEIKQNLEKELEKQKLLLKDSEISKAQAETDKLTVTRNSFLVGFFLLFCFGSYVYYAYRQKLISNTKLDARNKDLQVANDLLARSEGNFKQITESINDVFYLYNIKEKKYEYINNNSKSVLGLAPQYFYEGKSMKVVVHEDDKALVIDANVKIDMGIPYDIEYRIIINGHLKWIAEKSSPIFDENGTLVRNSGVCQDITRRKLAEEVLRKKNKDITDGIEYGSKIQNAILVPKDKIAKTLGDYFILLKPKDIVSGDFYFYTETKDGIIIAACDCTGHGVSAGFMSMIGNAFLHEIVTAKGITKPAEILNELRVMIIESLHQEVSRSETNDGIDISLLLIDSNKKYCEFAGAFNSLYHIRNNELNIIKADLFPVGVSFSEKQNPFTNTKVDLQKGDCLYIFSDGFADQFGGPQGKKFMRSQLSDLLLSVQTKNMNEQESFLNESFHQWKGSLDQVDDVLIIGIKI